MVFEMDRGAWMILVMGFDGAEALRIKKEFVSAFDRLEQIAMGKSMQMVPSADQLISQAATGIRRSQ
ncbi:hypothetical protein DESC_240076 [Desulfosarcina cetonica]|uniref:Rha family transcriptional regulator n=1 Tax=Desulfosarcina cetonica TaxID=90730 RepID=UPI0006CF92CF|nr:Rha family transcriptional regulator [Desulfosarcina cetonica]VTR64685.1 hypothetical protein DESC_240076 [Desulfosarcina cetonica]